MSRRLRDPRVWAPAVCAVLSVAFVLEITVRPGGTSLARSIDDIAEMVAAAVAAALAGWRARRGTGRLRASWLLIGMGCAGWAIGEAIWCYYELLAGRDTPFPSMADAGFLVFPALAMCGLLTRPSAAFSGQGRTRVTLDATIVATGLFVVSWVTALGATYHAGGDSRFAELVSLAYPVSDLALLTVLVVVLTYARSGNRTGLAWIGLGLIALCIGDSGFAYLTDIGKYGAVNLIDAGWVVGFLLVAVAAVVDRTADEPTTVAVAPRNALLLPYLPTTAAVVLVLHQMTSGSIDGSTSVAASALVTAIVLRQMLVLLDNRSLMAHISHQAFHDALTGLANRGLFMDRLSHALELHRRDMRPVTVMLLDLDDFKTVNDSLGHTVGDELLVRVSERLSATMRAGDTVARLGGDEFAILMEDGTESLDAAGRLLQSLDFPIALAGRQLAVRASIGVATLSPADPSTSATEMLKRADVAMYAAKRNGKATVVPYTETLSGGASEQLDLHAALVSDVIAGRIEVAYQPIHLLDGRVRGFEALARWTHQGKTVSPADFLPAAARAGVLASLDACVLRKAVREAMTWPDDIVLSVNVAGPTLADPQFAGLVESALRSANIPARRLSVEILETSGIEDDEAAMHSVRALRAVGVRVTVDDFGAGYASLARLQLLDPDVIKVDRSLLAHETDPDRPSALLTGVTELAHRLGALVVAEGVETETQLAAVRAAGCDAVQGFLLGRPTTPENCRALLERLASSNA
jgi:diguanylate cyclase (GGDEF)-like protein